MANQIRIRTSLELLQDVGGSLGAQEGITYTNLQHDGNAGARTWGGKYNTLTAYTDADIAYWNQAVIKVTTATAINADWDEGSITDGTLPVTAYVVAVEYTAELGTVGFVHVTVSGGVLAKLDLGESIVLPLSMGEAIADVKIHADVYSDGINEATVNVVVAGV